MSNRIRYRSTRGDPDERGFAEVVLGGLAPDGGLYQPLSWPRLAPEALAGGTGYAARAAAVGRPFVEGDVAPEDWERIAAAAYAAFDHRAVAPLVQVDANLWVMELFHGPTLAFKDIALQLLGRLFDHLLAARGERATIVGATSGDTGAAALEAVRGLDGVDIVMLHPAGRVSEVQRRQMTTIDAENVHNIAVEGTFDDCQALVKGLFADRAMAEEWRLAAVNSINWARIMAQAAYYAHAAAALGGGPVAFAVPSGNFGNVYAGWAARAMGVDIPLLIAGSNRNDVLTRFIEEADMSSAPVVPTLSPSMDIQVPSNFERLLHDLLGRDGAATRELMDDLLLQGRLDLGREAWERARAVFRGHSVGNGETLETIRRVHADTGLVLDPHTAVGLAAAEARRDPDIPTVALATAHPAKFPVAIEAALDKPPPAPERLARQAELPERMTRMPADPERLRAHIRERARRP